MTTGSMIFTFNTPLSAVGGFMNYWMPNADGDVTIAAYGIIGKPLDSYILDKTPSPRYAINTPVAWTLGHFAGIYEASGRYL